MVILKFRITINDQQNQYVLHLHLKSPWKASHIGFLCSVQFWNFHILPSLPDSFLMPSISQSEPYPLSYPRPSGLASGSVFPVPLLTLLQERLKDFSPSWIPIRTTSEKSELNFIKELTGVWNHTGLFNVKNICLKLTFGPIFASIRSQI